MYGAHISTEFGEQVDDGKHLLLRALAVCLRPDGVVQGG
jgi:hypothetical protein